MLQPHNAANFLLQSLKNMTVLRNLGLFLRPREPHGVLLMTNLVTTLGSWGGEHKSVSPLLASIGLALLCFFLACHTNM